MPDYTTLLYIIILIANIIILAVTAVNYFTAPVIRDKTINTVGKKISVLIPARNEEKNIRECIQSVIKQSYPVEEIIIYDDNSTDNTRDICNKLSLTDSRIRIIDGDELPEGWTGKNFACNNLGKEANGELLLFIDADVTLSRNAVAVLTDQFQQYNLDLLSVFPTQKMKSFGEYLIVPLMNWILLSFLPLILVRKGKSEKLAAANGQVMLFSREKYLAFGGHEKVKNRVVEDMAFAVSFKEKGYHVETALGGDAVFCRMYNGFSEAFAGFTKNFYPGTSNNPVVFLLLLAIFALLFLYPFYLIAQPGYDIITGIILLQRMLISIKSGQNIVVNILLHPFQMIAMILIGIKSLITNLTGTGVWKGRKI